MRTAISSHIYSVKSKADIFKRGKIITSIPHRKKTYHARIFIRITNISRSNNLHFSFPHTGTHSYKHTEIYNDSRVSSETYGREASVQLLPHGVETAPEAAPRRRRAPLPGARSLRGAQQQQRGTSNQRRKTPTLNSDKRRGDWRLEGLGFPLLALFIVCLPLSCNKTPFLLKSVNPLPGRANRAKTPRPVWTGL
jgi:hypothetical protein